MSDEQTPPRGGLRKDGKPYKEGNTREDGSYRQGKYRPPEETRYRVGDERVRGKRGAGRKNLLTEWREELDQKIPINENGKKRKVTNRRALIKTTINRGIKSSDRASETALRYAELSEKRDPGLQADDLAIITAWLEQMQVQSDSDDALPDERISSETECDDGEADDA